MNAWVLWYDYGEHESGAEIVRVYLDETRAREDFALVEHSMGNRYHLTPTSLIGHAQVMREANQTHGPAELFPFKRDA